MPERRKKHWIT